MAKKTPAVTSERVLRELGAIAFSQPEDGGPEVKTAEKMKALELIGRHLGMFEGAAGEGEDKFTVEVKVVD